jgi:exodeoxyribonuclease VIII
MERFENVMVDLETVGKRAGCGVLSIGAVAFDPKTLRPGEAALGPEFYQVVRLGSCEALGLHSDPSTMEWWEGQSKEARRVLTQAGAKRGNLPLDRALKKFGDYLTQFGPRRVKVWGNGSDFDNAILYACFAAAGLPVPWEFWNSRCFRTLKNLPGAPKAPAFEGTAHNALADAKHQAAHANMILAGYGASD